MQYNSIILISVLVLSHDYVNSTKALHMKTEAYCLVNLFWTSFGAVKRST